MIVLELAKGNDSLSAVLYGVSHRTVAAKGESRATGMDFGLWADKIWFCGRFRDEIVSQHCAIWGLRATEAQTF